MKKKLQIWRQSFLGDDSYFNATKKPEIHENFFQSTYMKKGVISRIL
jgi:hypothetical protein